MLSCRSREGSRRVPPREAAGKARKRWPSFLNVILMGKQSSSLYLRVNETFGHAAFLRPARIAKLNGESHEASDAVLASSLLTVAAEARGGGAVGGARIGSEHV